MIQSRVSKNISKKIEDWLSSIDDESLVNEIRKNIIVTGGCIVSLINNETPHDYDIYFRTQDVTKKVAQYYCDIFNKSINNNLHLHAWVLDGRDVEAYRNGERDFVYDFDDIAQVCDNNAMFNIPTDRIKIIIKSRGIAESTSNIETEEDINYMDLIQTADDISSNELDKLNKTEDKYVPIFISSNAITLSDKIQLITRFHGEPDEIHDTFDYVHCMCYWASWDKKMHYTVEALDAIMNKELLYVGSKYPICSVMRMRKFIKRGWNINAGQILKIAFLISQLDLQDINILEDQLVGVDSYYFMQAIEILRKLEEEKIAKGEKFCFDMTYLSSIIDKIFN